MVGEIRDFETAEIAVQAALTGHLVFSTLHTNDAAGGVTRLMHMGIQPISLRLPQGLSLLRDLCVSSVVNARRKSLTMPKGSFLTMNSHSTFVAKVVSRVDSPGTMGGQPIYEILLINEAIRELILARPHPTKSKRSHPSRYEDPLSDGLKKIAAGLPLPARL